MPRPTILCVDRTNDGRAPFTQAYLELLRVWLANTHPSRPWVFKDISSAGLLISSDFSRKHSTLFPSGGKSLFWTNQSRANLSLHAFAAGGTFESPEKRTIMARVGNRKLRGIRSSDFMKCFILCFDSQSYELLKLLRQAAAIDSATAQTAEIHLLEIGSDLHLSESEMRMAKNLLRKWARENLGWKAPGVDIKEGFWGTRQVVVTEAGVGALLREKEKRLVEIKRVTGAEVYFSEEMDGGGRVVSLVGSKERLDVAAMKVLYTW